MYVPTWVCVLVAVWLVSRTWSMNAPWNRPVSPWVGGLVLVACLLWLAIAQPLWLGVWGLVGLERVANALPAIPLLTTESQAEAWLHRHTDTINYMFCAIGALALLANYLLTH